MKRWAALVSFILFLALCASVVAWTMQLLKPARRAVAGAAVPEASVVVQLNAASALFGARKASAPMGATYAVKGVVVARKPGDSVAILVVDGKSAQALRVGAEIAPGITLKEVHPEFVLLSEAGRETRIDVPQKPSDLIVQDERQQRVNGMADTRAQAPGKASASSDAVPPRERQRRANRKAEAKNPAARAESD